MAHSLAFTKGHGTGNDFVIVADPEGALDLTDAQVGALCDRQFGIGADGLLRVVRTNAIPEGHEYVGQAEWFMDYRNADGSAAEMCGNGVRVFARFLADQKLTVIDETPIATRAGIKVVRAHERGYEVDLGEWTLDASEILVRAKGLEVARPGVALDLGNPHVVVALPSTDELDRLELAYQPVMDPQPRSGANIEFVVPCDPLVQHGVGAIKMRVFERGIGETLSCGTGVAAAALAVRHWAGPAGPDHWTVEVPGGTLGVRMADDHVYLSGPATLVYTGEIALA